MPDSAPLTHGGIARFYLPLALSWLFMAIEGPVCITVISRLREPELNTAAFNILMGIALFIESPVIDLLSTSTTLSKSRRDYATLSRFVCWLILGVTAAHALVVYTPLYWVVTRTLMGVPQPVAEAARLGLGIMLLWSACIGWRRYLQGILIRYHQTRMVGLGTAVRVATVAATSLALYFGTDLPGVAIGATALMASVAAEAAFAHWASRPIIRRELSAASDPNSDESEQGRLTMRRLVGFHMPLTLTTMVTLIGMPMVSAFLSQEPNEGRAVLNLAAWQVAFSLLWLFRTITFALPEVVITLYRDEATARKLRDFCLYIGLGTTAAVVLMAVFRLDVMFFERVYGRATRTAELAHWAFLAAAPLSLIGALQSYVRGMLTSHHLNVARFTAVMVSMATLVAVLAIGLLTPWRGVVWASAAFSVALTAELAVLAWAWRARVQAQAAERSAAPA